MSENFQPFLKLDKEKYTNKYVVLSPMIKFRYRKEPSIITGEVLRPVADVILEYSKCKVETAMYIDSGADITMLSLELGKALGFKQLPTDEIREIKGVSGSAVPYILKKARINHFHLTFTASATYPLFYPYLSASLSA